jgi:hypothetical protein
MAEKLLATTESSESAPASTPPANSPNGNQEPQIPAKATGNSDPKMFSQEDIEKAREQEKSKVYKRLETLQETVSRLENEAKARAEAEEQAQRLLEDEAKKKVESEMSAKDLLAQKEQEWAQQLSLVQQQMESEKALRERESQFAELMDYRQQVIQQYSDRVAPELLDLIHGDTADEINATAEDMAARTSRILAQTAEALQTTRQQTPTSRITAPSSGENAGSQRTFNPDEIRNMSMSEYAKHRKSLLGKGTDGSTSRGLFG